MFYMRINIQNKNFVRNKRKQIIYEIIKRKQMDSWYQSNQKYVSQLSIKQAVLT